MNENQQEPTLTIPRTFPELPIHYRQVMDRVKDMEDISIAVVPPIMANIVDSYNSKFLYNRTILMSDRVTMLDEADMHSARRPTIYDLQDSAKGQAKEEEQVLAFRTQDFVEAVLVAKNNNDWPSIATQIDADQLRPYFVRRGWAEKSFDFLQVLPYIFFWKQTDTGVDIFTYQRGKVSGEERLALNCSIGVGGHINPVDFFSTQQYAQGTFSASEKKIHNRRGDRLLVDTFFSGVLNALLRECDEEVVITDRNGEKIDLIDYIRQQIAVEDDLKDQRAQERWLYERTSFFLDYTANDVEKMHLGTFIGIEVPKDWDIRTREDVLVDVGFRSLDELFDDAENNTLPTRLECWSKSIVDSLASTIDYSLMHGNIKTVPLAAYADSVAQEHRWKFGTISGSMSHKLRIFPTNTFIKVK